MQKHKMHRRGGIVEIVIADDKAKGLSEQVGMVAMETGVLGRSKYGRTNEKLQKAGNPGIRLAR